MTTGLFSAPQWRISNIQVINWGGYDGHHTVDFAAGSTMITGPSGVGKSTLMDAYTALMMPSNIKFNSASNATKGRGRSGSPRNIVSYVRGKTDSVQETGQESRDHTLRGTEGGKPRSVAAAIAVRFRRDDGDVYTAMRLIFVRASMSSDSDLGAPTYATVEGDIDVLAVYKVFAEHPGQRRLLQSTFDGLSTYDGHGAFATSLQQKIHLGRAGEIGNALTLLSRIQEGRQHSTIDALYKDLVFEQPLAYDAAKEAVQAFQETSTAYKQMKDTQAQIDVLGDVEERYARYETAVGRRELIAALRHTEVGATPWEMWHVEIGATEYETCVATAEGDLNTAIERLNRADAAMTAANKEVKKRQAVLDAGRWGPFDADRAGLDPSPSLG